MSNSSFLEYLFETHSKQLQKPSDYLSLLCHSILLDKKCKLKTGKAVLPEKWNESDPIRLVYQTEKGVEINVSVVETSGDVFINLTESEKDGLGHMEVSADDYVNITSNVSLQVAYPQVEEFISKFETEVWQKAFPPKKQSSPKHTNKTTSSLIDNSREGYFRGPYRNPGESILIDPMHSDRRLPFDYGRADMDPFGLGSNPLGSGPGAIPLGGGAGGMLFDPRRPPENGPLYPGAPPLAGPPGARIDPIYPTIPGGFGGRGRGNVRPDPDMPHPPGWEDMYM